jgi:Secretion system C-terminal sorting domain
MIKSSFYKHFRKIFGLLVMSFWFFTAYSQSTPIGPDKNFSQKSDITYIDPAFLWKYSVPGWINPPTSVYIKFLSDSVKVDNKFYFKRASIDISKNRWEIGSYLFREFGGRVYSMKNGTEEVIYDFNLIVGDSITDENNGKLKVVKLDTIQTNDGKARRRWTFDKICGEEKIDYVVWVEGIGTTDGEYHPGAICIIADPSSQLSCFLENKVPVINLGNCYDELVNISETLFHSLEMSPMPVQNYLHIESKNIPIKEFKIYSNLGQMIFAKTVNESSIIEDFSFLESGAYFIQIQMENHQIVTRKLIKS